MLFGLPFHVKRRQGRFVPAAAVLRRAARAFHVKRVGEVGRPAPSARRGVVSARHAHASEGMAPNETNESGHPAFHVKREEEVGRTVPNVASERFT